MSARQQERAVNRRVVWAAVTKPRYSYIELVVILFIGQLLLKLLS